MLLLKDSHQKLEQIEPTMRPTTPSRRRRKNDELKANNLQPTDQAETESVLKELADFIESEGGILTP